MENERRKCRVVMHDLRFDRYLDMGRSFSVVDTAGNVFSFDALHSTIEWEEDVQEGDRVIDAKDNWYHYKKDSNPSWVRSNGLSIYDDEVCRPFKKQWRKDGTEVPQ